MANNNNAELKAQLEELQAKLAEAEADKAKADEEILKLKAEAEADKAKADEIKATVDEPEKTVKIKLPRIKGESDSVYVSINERDWLIKRGVEVEVPECVAILLDEQDKALEEAYKRMEAAKSRHN